MLRSSALCSLLLIASILSPAAGAAEKVPQDLLDYVQAARKLGLREDQIKANAVKAGWQTGVLDQALAETKAKPASAEAEPSSAAQSPAAAAGGIPVESPRSHGVPEDYRIGAGDVLQIIVWKEAEASVPSVVVRPDGKIAMPLLKDVEVVGLTPRETERLITDRLARLITAADVTVIVTQINSKKIFLVGAVRREGPVPVQYRMSILQAISEAGGLTDYAKRRKIYLLRTENGKQYRFPFDYEAVIKGEHMEQNIWVAPEDTIVVPH